MPSTKHPRTLLLSLALVMALMAAGASAQGSYEEQEGDIVLEAELDGDGQIDIGDDDGGGEAKITIREDLSELCWRLDVEGVDDANAAHIHEGGEDEDGPVVVTLSVDANATAEGCSTAEGAEVYERIAEDPEGFYVNVHSAEHPNGAVRGQLEEESDIFDGAFKDQGDDDGDDNNTAGDEDDGTGADPQEGTDADTPAPGFALALLAVTAAAAGFALRSRRK